MSRPSSLRPRKVVGRWTGQPTPEWQSGRPAHRTLRDLLGIHPRCGPRTHAVTNSGFAYPEGFRHFVSAMPAPVASGWSISPDRIPTY
jgi:hypothetical protein